MRFPTQEITHFKNNGTLNKIQLSLLSNNQRKINYYAQFKASPQESSETRMRSLLDVKIIKCETVDKEPQKKNTIIHWQLITNTG